MKRNMHKGKRDRKSAKRDWKSAAKGLKSAANGKSAAKDWRSAKEDRKSAKKEAGWSAKVDRKSAEYAPPGRVASEDTEAVVKFYRLPRSFPKEVLEEASRFGVCFAPRASCLDYDCAHNHQVPGTRRQAPGTASEASATLPTTNYQLSTQDRLDLRKKFIFTCDPEKARDFDDALSLWRDSLGRRVLGVHIADVSHYVVAGGAMDREAAKRSTSVYLADRVIPMLPEQISNGVCSLVPGEDRLTISVFITYDRSGKPVKCKFAKSVINSKARLTYEQVMGIIRDVPGALCLVPGAGDVPRASCLVPGVGDVPRASCLVPGAGDRRKAQSEAKKAQRVIKAIHELAQQLRAKRFADGALDLEVPETEVSLDDQGEMTGIVTYPYDESHQMVEECMVAANEAVARELWTHNIKIIGRFHDSPDPEKLMLLREELRGVGIHCGDLSNQKVFAQFMQTIKSSPIYSTLAVMVLRSMKRAVYDADNMGHWGLAKRFYSHFTSPIRRYPDLTLHRQLKAYLERQGAKKNGQGASRTKPSNHQTIKPSNLQSIAKHATEMEERATLAERNLLEIKKYRLLEEELASRMPIEYDAVIAKCERFGCFVDVPSIGVSGLVHISGLSRRYVKYNNYDHTLSALGQGGGSWKIGDVLRVRIKSVDFATRHLDFEVV